MSIAIVTSRDFSPSLKSSFLAGLRSNGWEGDPNANPGGNRRVTIEPPYEANGKYDDGDGDQGKHQELYNAVKASNANSNVQLIVALGGLVSAHAAWKASTKPFIVIVGSAPSFTLASNSNYAGGVNLDMGTWNTNRNAALCKISGVSDPKSICLIWNSKSKMGKAEQKAWANNGWPIDAQVSTNSDAAIVGAFAQAKQAKAQGVVISGDPYFTSRMNKVVAAANGSGLKICYPFQAYENAKPKPAPGSGIYLGPDLLAAYESIGQMAGTILTGAAGGIAVPNPGLVVANTGAPVPIAKPKTKPKKKPAPRKKPAPKKKTSPKKKASPKTKTSAKKKKTLKKKGTAKAKAKKRNKK